MKPLSKKYNYYFSTIINIIVIKILFLSSLYLFSNINFFTVVQKDSIQSNVYIISNNLDYFKLIDIKYIFFFRRIIQFYEIIQQKR